MTENEKIEGTEQGKQWQTFEDVVRSIIDQHRDYFGLSHVGQEAQKVESTSGYEYNVEIVAYAKDSNRVVLFEVRHRGRNIEPEQAGGFAYRIQSTGAQNGYFVTKIGRGLSRGAQQIADYEEIGHIQVSADATSEEYIMQHLNDFFLGVVCRATVEMKVEFQLIDKDGNIISQSPAWV